MTPMSLSKLMFVIRCRECKYFYGVEVPGEGTDYWCTHPNNRGIVVGKDDYCPRAERREGYDDD